MRRPFSSFPLLPSGVRDHLPLASLRLREVQGQVRDAFARWGYEGVITPLYEYLAVLERGLGRSRRRETFKFIEPRTGEIVALRPDITPQIARLFATRFETHTGVTRLAYDGRVVRFAGDAGALDDEPQDGDVLNSVQRAGAKAAPREVFQAGAELLGAGGPDADAEVVALLCSALRAAGISRFQIDLGHGEIARATLEAALPEPASRRQAAAHLARKDEAALRQLCEDSHVPEAHRAAVLGLCAWYGPLTVLDEAAQVLVAANAQQALTALRETASRLVAEDLGQWLSVDLGELRDQGYHDGVFFHAYAAPVPGPIASGGRYDHLTERFGRSAPATGFAIDLEALLLAKSEGGEPGTVAPRAVLLDGEGPVVRSLADALRDAGLAVIRALPLDRTEAARSAYAAEIELSNGRLRLKCKGVFAGDHDAAPLLSHGYAAVVQLVMETLGAPATDG